jgi:hypothetical protein
MKYRILSQIASWVQTVKRSNVFGPNVLLIATSVASRPWPMSTRPRRGALLRGSNVCQAPRVGWLSDIAEIAGAIARRDVQAAAEGDRQMRVIPAHADALVIRLQGRAGGPRLLVVEGDMLVHKIAHRLYPGPARGDVAEQSPGDLGQFIGLAITATQEEEQRVIRQVLDLVLPGIGGNRVGQPRILHRAGTGDA